MISLKKKQSLGNRWLLDNRLLQCWDTVTAKFSKSRNRDPLDLTNNNYKQDSKWQYVGLKLISRPWKRGILAISLAMCSVSVLTPDLSLGAIIGIKFLKKYG